MVDQRALDREHAPVHHVARSDAVCARAGVVERDLGDALGGGRRVDRAILAEVSTVSVRCVFAQTHVGGDVQRREELAECFDGEDHWALGVVCGRPYVVLIVYHHRVSVCAPFRVSDTWLKGCAP